MSFFAATWTPLDPLMRCCLNSAILLAQEEMLFATALRGRRSRRVTAAKAFVTVHTAEGTPAEKSHEDVLHKTVSMRPPDSSTSAEGTSEGCGCVLLFHRDPL